MDAVSRYNLPGRTLEEIKNYLDITWDDEATDQKISGLIAAGMVYLNGKAGGEMDYDADGMARTLLFEYVRYMRDNALDVFENNYLALLVCLQNERRVAAYVASAQQGQQ